MLSCSVWRGGVSAVLLDALVHYPLAVSCVGSVSLHLCLSMCVWLVQCLVRHHGKSARGGHYTSLVRGTMAGGGATGNAPVTNVGGVDGSGANRSESGDGATAGLSAAPPAVKWYKHDDSCVTEVREAEVTALAKRDGYLLFFVLKCDP